MNIPLWELVALFVMLLNGGIAIGFYSSRFVTHAQCRMRRADCVEEKKETGRKELDERKKVWTKVDFLYDREISRHGPPQV